MHRPGFSNAEMQYSKYFPLPPIFLSFRQKPMKCMTFLDHFKSNPDLCMQTQMKTDSLVDEKGKATQAWSTRFCDMLMTEWPCQFPVHTKCILCQSHHWSADFKQSYCPLRYNIGTLWTIFNPCDLLYFLYSFSALVNTLCQKNLCETDSFCPCKLKILQKCIYTIINWHKLNLGSVVIYAPSKVLQM